MTPGWSATATLPTQATSTTTGLCSPKADRTVMLNTAANWATIVSTIFGLSSIYYGIWRAIKGYFLPKGLRLLLEPTTDNEGFCVHITNFGSIDHHIATIGSMPAKIRPLRSILTKRFSSKRNLRESLSTRTASAVVNKNCEPGRNLYFVVPQPLPSCNRLPAYKLEGRDAIRKRYYEWVDKNRPGGPLPLVPYALLGDGSVVLGKKTRINRRKQLLTIEPVCKCGHHITQHVAYQRKRLAPTMTTYRRCEKCWCLWFRQSDKQSDANKIISSTIALKAATFPHKSRIIEESAIGEAVEDIAKTDSPPTHNASSRQSATNLKESR